MPNPTTRKRLGSLRAIVLAVTVALAVGACSSSGAGSSRSDSSTLKLGLSAEPPQLVTGTWQGAAAAMLVALTHRGLMSVDDDGEIVPALAESVETPDPTTYVFTMRDGLTFHDGSKLTTENIKSSLEYYARQDTGSNLYAGLKDIDTITADDTTVTIKLKAPNNSFLEYLAVPTAAVVPDASLNPKTANTVGAGPYVFGKQTQGVGVEMTKFDGYYAADDVALKTVDVAYYADGDARANALLGGDVDMIDYVTWENFDRVKDTAGMTLDATPGPFQYVQFNAEKGPFAKAKVRQAVGYAINRDNALEAAFQGKGKALAGPVVPEDDEDLKGLGAEMWTYDPDRAKQLLAEAGYPDGFSATLLTTSQYTFLQDTALSVQEDLKAVGIDVKLDAPDWSGRLAKGAKGDYDIAVSGDVGIIKDPSYLLTLVNPPNTFNRSWGYSNDELAAKITDGLRATDGGERRAAYTEAFDIFAADVPFVPIDTRDQAFAYTSDLKGFSNLPGFLTFFSGYSLADASFAK